MGTALLRKYFGAGGWESAIAVPTGEWKAVADYAGISLPAVLELSYGFYLLCRRDAWLTGLRGSEAGRELLKTMWRLNQTEPDWEAVHQFAAGGEKG